MSGAGIVLHVLETMLTLEGMETRATWLGEERPGGIRQGRIVVLAARPKPRFTAEAVQALGLRAVGGGPPRVHSQLSLYGLYRFGPASIGGTKPARQSSSSRGKGSRVRAPLADFQCSGKVVETESGRRTIRPRTLRALTRL